jgi:hypothetical protein
MKRLTVLSLPLSQLVFPVYLGVFISGLCGRLDIKWGHLKVGPCLTYKYKTTMEMYTIIKHSSLLCQSLTYVFIILKKKKY